MITIRRMHFRYQNTLVFENVSLQMMPGFIYGILGKNGSGKSTLLYHIAGLLLPQGGEMSVLGFTPHKRSPAFLQEVFMIPEEFYLPDISIRNLVKYYSPFYPRFDANKFDEHLTHFHIPNDHTLQAMSYGQKKKVLISFGLACNTSLLLMDEPTNGLDIISKSQFRKAIAGSLNANNCIVISSHHVQDLENMIDHVVILDNTRILLQQSLRHIAKKLSFTIARDSGDMQNVLYCEPSLAGDLIVSTQENGEEGRLDLELLYKATMARPEAMQSIFLSSHP